MDYDVFDYFMMALLAMILGCIIFIAVASGVNFYNSSHFTRRCVVAHNEKQLWENKAGELVSKDVMVCDQWAAEGK